VNRFHFPFSKTLFCILHQISEQQKQTTKEQAASTLKFRLEQKKKLPIRLAVSTESVEIYHFAGIQFPKDRSPVAGDINTTAVFVFSFERMVV
jgi:hypothetical protein